MAIRRRLEGMCVKTMVFTRSIWPASPADAIGDPAVPQSPASHEQDGEPLGKCLQGLGPKVAHGLLPPLPAVRGGDAGTSEGIMQVGRYIIQGEVAGADKSPKNLHGGGAVERPLQHPGEVPYGVPEGHELRRHTM
jgi:hypothetical protein